MRFSLRPATIAILPLPSLCSGCARAPSFSVFGAFFPAWMVCALLGLAAALLIGAIAGRAAPGWQAWPMLYPLLALLCGVLLWLAWFRG